MIIKKFSSKTEFEAIENARKELGPDVVVMNVRTVKKKGILKFFSSPQVEVTVALEEEGEKQPAKAPAMTALEQLAAKQREINEKNSAAQKNTVATPTVKPVQQQVKREEVIIKEHEEEDKSSNALEEKLDSIETLIKMRLESEDSKASEKETVSEPHNEENDQMKLTKLLYNMMI